MDVSSHQQNVNWVSAYAVDSRFCLRESDREHLLHQPLLCSAVQQLVAVRHSAAAPGKLLDRGRCNSGGWEQLQHVAVHQLRSLVGDSNFFLGTVNDLKALAKKPNAVHRNWVNGQDRAAWNLPKSASVTKQRGIYSTIKRTYKNERHLAEVPLVLSLRDASFEQHKIKMCSVAGGLPGE